VEHSSPRPCFTRFVLQIHAFPTPVAQLFMSDFILDSVKFFPSPEPSFDKAKTLKFQLVAQNLPMEHNVV